MSDFSTSRPGFLLYHDDIAALSTLTDAQVGRLVRCLYILSISEDDSYSLDPSVDADIAVAFSFMSHKIVRDKAKYFEKSAKSKKAASARWECDRMRSHSVASERIQTEAVTKTVTETVKEAEAESLSCSSSSSHSMIASDSALRAIAEDDSALRAVAEDDSALRAVAEDDSALRAVAVDDSALRAIADDDSAVVDVAPIVDLISSKIDSLFCSASGKTASPFESSELRSLCDLYSFDWVKIAIQRSALRGKPYISYIKGILSSFSSAGSPDNASVTKQQLSSSDYPQRLDSLEDLYMEF